MWDNSTSRPTSEPIAWKAMHLTRGEHVYDEKYINRLIADYLRQSCAEVHLCTQVDLSIEAESKFNFINRHCPGLLTDYVGVSSAEAKVQLLQAYERAGSPKDSMLMIDDYYKVVRACMDVGYEVQEPQFIMGRLYDKKVHISFVYGNTTKRN